MHLSYQFVSDDAAASCGDDAGKQVGHLLTAADETVGAFDIQHIDQRMDIGRGMTEHTAIHGVHISQYIPQTGILDIGGNQVAGSPEELVAVGEQVRTAFTQMEEIHLVGHPIERLHIGTDALFLVGELTDEIIRKRLPTLRDTELPTVGQIADAVHAVVIQLTHLQLVIDTQIAADLIDRTARTQTTEDMHARLEGDTTPREGLQSAAGHGVFLDYRHLVAFLREQGACKETAQSATYYYNRLSVHVLAFMMS